VGYPAALLLALVQGLTEFLPVSSSGHLVLAQLLFESVPEDLFFDVLLHVATLAAVLLYFRRDLWALALGVLRPRPRAGDGPSAFEGSERRVVLLTLLATAVTAALGFPLRGAVEASLQRPLPTGLGLLGTSALLLATLLRKAPGTGWRGLAIWQAAVIGLAQGVAVFPGVSRSGATVAVALLLGLRRDVAVRFSFFLAVPAILGAFLLELRHLSPLAGAWGPYGAGAALAFAVGLASIHLLYAATRRGWLHLFGFYCAPLGLLAILWDLFL
jgi:undecaprenyl-diphosphatase